MKSEEGDILASHEIFIAVEKSWNDRSATRSFHYYYDVARSAEMVWLGG